MRVLRDWAFYLESAHHRGHDTAPGQIHTLVRQLAGQTGQTGAPVTSSLLGSCSDAGSGLGLADKDLA